MRKQTLLLTSIAVALALPLQAARSKNQSYFSYDDGGTIVRQGDDNREIDARVNLPVFPGDEVITNRRGRSEVRLSDGNVVAIDRATSIVFRSILDSYDGDNDESIAELRYGKVMVYRTAEDRDSAIRVDTPSASYYASDEAIFSVESDTRGKDRVSVFEGTIEVRTPIRTTRLRRGEEASVDDRGLYSLASDGDNGADDFERWFLRRAERYGKPTSRYLDRSLASYEDDLGRYGSWTYVDTYGYVWRPYGTAVGWRPYYYGYWERSRSGCLVWVSYEPWGWAPYHYGRWSYDPLYGWFWLPGYGYAPAWVYWWYGNGFLGWAPAGWYDCYRPYYDWAYRPYHRVGLDFGFGFYGRVRVNDVDLRPWTFIDGNNIISNRVDRVALTTDVIRERLQRGGNGGFATISGAPARFTRSELRDPSMAINRKNVGTGAGGGNTPDMTPFFRRDPDPGANIRDRVTRTRPVDGGTRAGADTSGTTSRGALAPIGGGSVAPIGGGALAPISPGGDSGETAGRIRSRTDIPRTDIGNTPGRIDREHGETPAAADAVNQWRERANKPRSAEPSAPATPRRNEEQPAGTSWRDRVAREAGKEGTPSTTTTPAPADRGRNNFDVPRRIIDRIGGARVTPSGDGGGSSRSGSNGGSRESSPPPRVERAPARESAPPPPPPRQENHDNGGGDHRGSDGHVKRDH